MAKAKREGGLYYVNSKAVDAEGRAIEGAPAQPKDTDPSEQPGSAAPLSVEDRLANAVVKALGQAGAAGVTAISGGVKDSETHTLPTISELGEHLATLQTVEEVQALRATDERKGALKLYEARIAEIESA